jgi:hypothetical protein
MGRDRKVLGNLEAHGSDSFIGGILQGKIGPGWNLPWPFAKLEVFDEGVRVGPSRPILRYIVPTWEAHKSEFTEIQAIGGIANGGVRFRIVDAEEWIIFWTFRADECIRRIEMHGIKTVPGRAKNNFFNPNK